MQRFVIASLILLLYTAGALAQGTSDGQPPFNPKERQPVSQTKFFLKLSLDIPIHPGAVTTGIPDVDEALAAMGVQKIRRMADRPLLAKRGADGSGIHRLLIVTVTPQENMERAVERFEGKAGVEYASPYRTHRLAYEPDDPRYPGQWELAQMEAAQAWDVTQGDSTMAIGVIDTGVDLLHPDLAPNIYVNPGEWGSAGELSDNGADDDGNGFVDDWQGWDFIGAGSASNPAPDNEPQDNDLGHGTGVAGCASAATDNGIGIAAPGFRTKLLPVKVAADVNNGVEAGYEGIMYAIEMGCPVIVCGWELDLEEDPAMHEIVDYAHNNGSLIIVAAGNGQSDLDISRRDAVIQRTLHAGGTTSNTGLSFFSNRGTAVDVYAPGSAIRTTGLGGGYDTLDGTSYAAGYAAGVAALVKSAHPEWTPDQVAKQLHVTSVPFSAGRRRDAYGILNAYNAVTQNENLDEIPGIVVRNVNIAYPEGDGFTAIGQTATVTARLVNLLSPTSPQAEAELTFRDDQVSSPTATIPIGALGTYDSTEIQFDVTLTEKARYTHATVPFELTFTDGEYVDYGVGYIEYEGLDGWELKYDSFSSHSVRAIDAVDKSVVWAVLQTSIYNYSIIRTTDGGETWDHRAGEGFPVDYRVRALSAIDENTALIGIWAEQFVDAAIYRTTDGGDNWERFPTTGITDFINFVHMFDRQEGVYVGDGLAIYWGVGKTYNGGGRWIQPAELPVGVGEVGVGGVADFAGNTGFFGTYNKKVWKTSDKGETWNGLPVPAQNTGGIAMRNEQHVLMRFFNDGSQGTNKYALSKDGGRTFTDIAPAPAQSLGFVAMEPDGQRMWICIQSNIYVSSDDGETWTLERLPQRPVGIFGQSDIVTDGDKTWVYACGTEIFKRELDFEPYTVGVRKAPSAGTFALGAYPNPVSSGTPVTLTVAAERPGAMEYVLYDLYGRKVYERPFEAGAGETSVHIPTRGLAAGVYNALVRNGSETRSVRVTVLR